jgi:hypothetical protein
LKDRIKNIEEEYNKYYTYLREVSSTLLDISNESSNDYEDIEFSKYWTYEYLYRMYNLLCVYLETLGLHDYLRSFKEKFEPVIKDEKKAIEISAVLLKYGDSSEDLLLLIEWKKFLAPFGFFWDKQNEINNRKVIEYLECTNEVLKLTKTKVYKEEDINSIIREVAKLYFNGVTGYSEGYFVQQFKNYKPDIIIKEAGVAIEYKLIREDKDIGIKLDELLIDAKRYTGNHQNKDCIAVFCLSQNIKRTKKEIKEDWNNMEFPKNWELVIVSDIKIENSSKTFISK